ncbi:PH domain-containing protein [Aeromicrobium alkaliterrae]|uniref:PH domain-containing protein n=1 Tax=Aeromicrobium alkaliterrae TaxID=302168 RepID=A0ABP4VNC5_9ACTN
MSDPFDPQDTGWTPVSPRLATARILIGTVTVVVVAVLVLAVLAVIAATTSMPTWLLAVPIVLALAAVAWLVWWAPRNARSWGYQETEEELLVRHGIMFRRLVAVPYGRMQFVDVEIGPLARRLGFAKLSLHTASTETASTVPGVPHEEALRLRVRLTELGESRGAGV